MKKALLLALLALLFAAPEAQAGQARYYVPPSQFNAAFQIMDLGLSNIFGLFQNATGAFAFDPGSKTISHIKLAIDATSLMVPNASASKDLTKLLDPDAYPELTFLATAATPFQDGKAQIKGTLTIHGQSKPATFEGTLNSGKEAADSGESKGSETIGLSLRGTFKRADFAMGDEPEIPGRFGENMTLMLEMQAIKP